MAYWSIAGFTVVLRDLALDGVEQRLKLVLVCGLVARRAVDRRQFSRHDWVTVSKTAVGVHALRGAQTLRWQLVRHGLVRHAVLRDELPALPVKEHLRRVTWLSVQTVHGGG